MNKLSRPALPLLAALVLAGCASSSNRPPPHTLYDLGPVPLATNGAMQTVATAPSAALSLANLPPIAVPEPDIPAWLDTPSMLYRLSYANDQQVRRYANSRWSMPPADLFVQRLRTRLAQSGAKVLSSTTGNPSIALLRVEAEDFTHDFASGNASSGNVAVRVSLLANRTLVAQRSFERKVDAPSPDAPGGARALASASDAVIADIIAWLAQVPAAK